MILVFIKNVAIKTTIVPKRERFISKIVSEALWLKKVGKKVKKRVI
jgi:hypothetical protein